MSIPTPIVKLSIFSCGHFNIFFANFLLMFLKTHIFGGPIYVPLSTSWTIVRISWNNLSEYVWNWHSNTQMCWPRLWPVGWGSGGMAIWRQTGWVSGTHWRLGQLCLMTYGERHLWERERGLDLETCYWEKATGNRQGQWQYRGWQLEMLFQLLQLVYCTSLIWKWSDKEKNN